jgi:hypothetical protein
MHRLPPRRSHAPAADRRAPRATAIRSRSTTASTRKRVHSASKPPENRPQAQLPRKQRTPRKASSYAGCGALRLDAQPTGFVLQAGGPRFEPATAHHPRVLETGLITSSSAAGMLLGNSRMEALWKRKADGHRLTGGRPLAPTTLATRAAARSVDLIVASTWRGRETNAWAYPRVNCLSRFLSVPKSASGRGTRLRPSL